MGSNQNELKTLGQHIREARRGLQMSQEELAFRCGLHRTYLSDVERGLRNLSFFSLLALAKGLGLSISELTRGIEPAAERESRVQPGGVHEAVVRFPYCS